MHGSGKIRNVGAQGLFVVTKTIPDEGETVCLCFVPPGESEIHLTGVVWWTTRSCPDRAQRAPGFGLRLIEDSEVYDRAIRRMLS